MNLKPSHKTSGLGLIALLIVIAAILIIGGAIVYILVKICQRCLPPPPDNGGGNRIETNFYDPATTNPPPNALVLPTFQFPELPAPRNATAENPLGDAIVFLERTTNLVDWQVILSTNLSYQFCWCDDTNPPSSQAFYRLGVHYP